MSASVDPLAASIETLAQQVTGRVAVPSDNDWDTVRMAWNLSIDQHPRLVALPENTSDIVAIVNFARSSGLQVAPQGTGHNAGPLGDLSDAILLRTDRLREVTVDPEHATVRVGPGVTWTEVTDALAPHGLIGRAGSSGSVGVTGYSIGGGYSWLARKHGLAVSSITAVELVTGDGTFHRVDAETEPDLFWAVRGGGANVGIVCALEFGVLPLPQVYGGALLFPMERASEVFAAYELWTRDLDDSATTCLRLLRLPPMPELPEFLRGHSFVGVDGAIDASAEDAERMLAPLRALKPAVDTFAIMPTPALGMIHMDPPAPAPARGDGMILEDLPSEAIDALLAVAGPGIETPLLAVDLRHLGGALGRPDSKGGAVNHLPGRFLLYAVGITPVPEAVAAVESHIAAVKKALAPWSANRDYVNFRDSSDAASKFYDQETIDRLTAVRFAHDPDQIIRSNHPVTATA
ncbi:MAG: FAD-binding oxidoreductase [Lacisediminihabitans sp.]